MSTFIWLCYFAFMAMFFLGLLVFLDILKAVVQ